jgi:hypothetical protein
MALQKVLTASVDRYVLTPSQCMMIRQDAEVIGMKRATVLNKDGTSRRSFARSCSSCWIPYAQHNNWIYNIMRELTDAINAEHWRIDITGMQQLQILKYNPLQQFWWHFDTYTSEAPVRKLTAVINLSAPNEYLGGGQHFFHVPAYQVTERRPISLCAVNEDSPINRSLNRSGPAFGILPKLKAFGECRVSFAANPGLPALTMESKSSHCQSFSGPGLGHTSLERSEILRAG